MLKLITISSQFENAIFFIIESQAEDADNGLSSIAIS